MSAYGLLGGCAHALLSMWVRSYSSLRYAMNDGHWKVSVTFVGLFVIVFAVILSPFPLPMTSPTTLGPNIPCVLFPSWRPLGRKSPPRWWARGGDTYNWRAAAPTLFAFVLAGTCTMLRQDLTPSLSPTQHPCMQPHFTLTSSQPTPLWVRTVGGVRWVEYGVMRLLERM